jgi:hypothetical protein
VELRSVVIVLWLALVLVALVVRYPDTFRAANQTARANAALDLLDREVGGGNSVIPDQEVLVEALGRIPLTETFAVAVGEPQQGWTDLTATYAETFFRYFLLPRRVDPNAPWILCLACDANAFPGARPVWKGENGIVILRRRS